MATKCKLPDDSILLTPRLAYRYVLCPWRDTNHLMIEKWQVHRYSARTSYGERTRWRLEWSEYARKGDNLATFTPEEARAFVGAETERLRRVYPNITTGAFAERF